MHRGTFDTTGTLGEVIEGVQKAEAEQKHYF